MRDRRGLSAGLFVFLVCALIAPTYTGASGVPIGGFLPFLGIGLTDEFKDENDDTFFFADSEASYTGTPLGAGGNPYFDLALLDTGAAVSLLTTASDTAFNIQGEGFRGTETLTIGGATGFLEATINDSLAMFATGLANRMGVAPLNFNTATMVGQSSMSLLTVPPESDLPNVVGIPFAAQYATYIRSDQPQIFTHNERTVRSPQIEFLPLGSGGQGITRRAPITLESPNGFLSPPLYIFNFENILNGDPLTDNPQAPTVLQEPGAYFLSVNVENEGESLDNFQFFFDTGADVTVLSELNATRLGFDVVLDEPEFTIAVVGSGGVHLEVPGFFVDQFTIQAVGGNVTLTNVPVVVLDVTNPADPGNVVDGIVGTNLLAGRNIVIDPKPSTGGGGVGPSLYISDPITTQKNWMTIDVGGNWSTGSNWSDGTVPGPLDIVNVRHISGRGQSINVSTDTTFWELNVSATTSESMLVRVHDGVTLTTFSGMNIEGGGIVDLQHGMLDAQFIEIIGGGKLNGAGIIKTGSGPIPGQVENRNGTVGVGDVGGAGIGTLEIAGRFANAVDGMVAFHVGGLTAGTQYDQLIVDGGVALDGTLLVTLANYGTFTPGVGDAFTLITATDGISGMFETLLLPSGYQWAIEYGVNNVQLSVAALGLAGDFNGDGSVDAADYIVWRKTGGTAEEYQTWRSNFGNTASAPSNASAAGVPEPGTGLMLLIATAASFVSSRVAGGRASGDAPLGKS